MESVKAFISKVNDAIVNPLIILLIAAATAYFLWGLAQFVMNADDATKREEGKQKIVWGLIGLTIMVSVSAILNILLGTFDVSFPEGSSL